MKGLYKQLQKCKSIKEIIEIVPNEVIIKLSYYSLSLWCLIPILILITNIFVKESSSYYCYTGLFVIGFIGIINGIIYMYKNKLKLYKKIPFILLLIFLIWSFFSCLLAPNQTLAFLGTSYRKEGFLTYIFYMGFFLNGFIVSKSSKYIKNILKWLIISSTIVGLLITMNNNLTDILLKSSNAKEYSILTGIFSNSNHYGYYLTVSIMAAASLFLYEKKNINKLLYFGSFILLVYVLGKNNTLGCFVALLVSFIIILIYSLIIKENRIKIFIILITFLCISLDSPFKNDMTKLFVETQNIYNHLDNLEVKLDNTIGSSLVICSGTNRLDLWLKGIDFIKSRPLFGYGFENLEDLYFKTAICDKTDRPHNTFIQIGANTGVVGLIIYMSCLIYIFVTGLQINKKLNKMITCCFFITLSYLISSCFGNSMYYTSPYYLFFLGIISSICIRKKKDIEIS